MQVDLTDMDRHLIKVSVHNYIREIRDACLEDQGTPDGKPCTVGHEVQKELRIVLDKLNPLRSQA
jgi:hypothetical protein